MAPRRRASPSRAWQLPAGWGSNSALASAVNVLGDVHGGAGEQAVELYLEIARRIEAGETGQAGAVQAGLDVFVADRGGKVIPGFGHRFHPIDPRAEPLLALVDKAAARGDIDGRFARIARAQSRTPCRPARASAFR